MLRALQNKDTQTGLVISLALNGAIAGCLLVFSLIMAMGIGMSSNTDAENSVANTTLFLWGCIPMAINLPALGIALARKGKSFTGGWLAGCLGVILGVVLIIASIIGFVWIMQTFFWR